MAGLGAAVRGDVVGRDGRLQPGGDQGGGRADEAVQDDEHAPRGGFDGDAGQCGDLEAADRPQCGVGVGRAAAVGEVKVKGALDDGDLVAPAGVVHAGAAAGDVGG